MIEFEFRFCPFCGQQTAGEKYHLDCLLHALLEELIKLNQSLSEKARKE